MLCQLSMYVQTMGVTVLEGKGYPTEMQNKILIKKNKQNFC